MEATFSVMRASTVPLFKRGPKVRWAHHGEQVSVQGDFCEWSDCDFSSANSICKHSCFLLFSARISVTHSLTRRQP